MNVLTQTEKKKGGRPKKDQRKKRDKRIYIHVSQEELDFLGTKAHGCDTESIRLYARRVMGLQ